jgi:arylsulfatase A-like enzyme
MLERASSPHACRLACLALVLALTGGAACSRHRELAPAPTTTASATAQEPGPPREPLPPAAAAPGLNVLLITVDSLRADMPWAGYARPIAPVLTAFAESAVVYERFYAVSSYTAMSVAGLLAGRYPSELDRSGHYFAHWGDVLFFPEVLRSAGVRTLSAQSHFYFDQRAGFRRAFDVYELVPGLEEDHQTVHGITSPAQLELGLRMLSDGANVKGRFFAWMHFIDPHDKYEAHAGIEYGHGTRDLYDAEVTFTDQHIGRLLDFVAAQPWGAQTAVIVSADHGEAFGEHQCFRHGFELWDVLTHVPLMIRVPGVAARRIDTPRSALDLAPTILDLFGLPTAPAMEGVSLVPELRGTAAPARDVILDLPRTTNSDRRRALIRGDYKLIAIGDDDAFQLFDLRHDPGEEHDVKWTERDKFAEMKAAYEAASAKIPSVCPRSPEKLHGKKRHLPC